MAFVRNAGAWAVETFAGMEAMLTLPEVGIEVPLAEIYGDVALAPPES